MSLRVDKDKQSYFKQFVSFNSIVSLFLHTSHVQSKDAFDEALLKYEYFICNIYEAFALRRLGDTFISILNIF